MSKETVRKTYIEPRKCFSCRFARLDVIGLGITCSLGEIYVMPDGVCDLWQMHEIVEEKKPEVGKEKIKSDVTLN